MGDDIRKQLKKFLPLLLEAQSVNLNESDTVFRLVKVFEEVLGYDPMKEIKSEYEVNGKYVDLAVQVDDAIRFFVEAKGAGVDLKVAFITKTEIYAAEGNVPWVLLTNGVAWNLYHLSFKQKTGLKYDLVFAVDLGSDELDKATELLGLLHRQSIRSGAHQKYWDLVNALRPESLGKALFTEEVLRFIRRNVRKQGGPLIDIIHGVISNAV